MNSRIKQWLRCSLSSLILLLAACAQSPEIFTPDDKPLHKSLSDQTSSQSASLEQDNVADTDEAPEPVTVQKEEKAIRPVVLQQNKVRQSILFGPVKKIDKVKAVKSNIHVNETIKTNRKKDKKVDKEKQLVVASIPVKQKKLISRDDKTSIVADNKEEAVGPLEVLENEDAVTALPDRGTIDKKDSSFEALNAYLDHHLNHSLNVGNKPTVSIKKDLENNQNNALLTQSAIGDKPVEPVTPVENKTPTSDFPLLDRNPLYKESMDNNIDKSVGSSSATPLEKEKEVFLDQPTFNPEANVDNKAVSAIPEEVNRLPQRAALDGFVALDHFSAKSHQDNHLILTVDTITLDNRILKQPVKADGNTADKVARIQPLTKNSPEKKYIEVFDSSQSKTIVAKKVNINHQRDKLLKAFRLIKHIVIPTSNQKADERYQYCDVFHKEMEKNLFHLVSPYRINPDDEHRWKERLGGISLIHIESKPLNFFWLENDGVEVRAVETVFKVDSQLSSIIPGKTDNYRYFKGVLVYGNDREDTLGGAGRFYKSNHFNGFDSYVVEWGESFYSIIIKHKSDEPMLLEVVPLLLSQQRRHRNCRWVR